MATALRKYENREVVVHRKVSIGTMLKLDDAEARTLLLILRHVGGDPYLSARKYADQVAKALHDAGYLPIRGGDGAVKGGIHLMIPTKDFVDGKLDGGVSDEQVGTA